MCVCVCVCEREREREIGCGVCDLLQKKSCLLMNVNLNQTECVGFGILETSVLCCVSGID